MTRPFASRAATAVCVGALFLSGCGPAVKLVPVSGKVTLDGQAVTSGQVTLYPTTTEKTEGATAGLCAGTIDPEGTYKIFTAGKEGPPSGSTRPW
jgi:hypothetical protein